MNIEPGMLCLVTAGDSAGTSVKVLQQVSEEEVLNHINEKLGRACQPWNGKYVFWSLDTEVIWGSKEDRTLKVSLPFEAEKYLLPIPPLKDLAIQQTKQQEYS